MNGDIPALPSFDMDVAIWNMAFGFQQRQDKTDKMTGQCRQGLHWTYLDKIEQSFLKPFFNS